MDVVDDVYAGVQESGTDSGAVFSEDRAVEVVVEGDVEDRLVADPELA
jgi:hypothetical protein